MTEADPDQATPTATSAPGTGSVTDARLLAAQLFNETWRLLELESRNRDDDDRMIHTAHASRCHWGQVPGVTPAHLARGEWQISRVYAVLGRAEPALHHARRVLDLCQENGIGDWDLAFSYEALARDRDGGSAILRRVSHLDRDPAVVPQLGRARAALPGAAHLAARRPVGPAADRGLRPLDPGRRTRGDRR
jgi:hypothetical protein